jgi:hypothetical protein
MNAVDYLDAVLTAESVEDDSTEMQALLAEKDAIETLLKAELADAKPDVRLGGSIAKKTIVRASFDLDTPCYFDNDDTGAGETLKEIHEHVHAALSKSYVVETRRSALRLVSRKNGDALGFTVDVVPGRFVDDQRSDVFLYQAEGDKERLKTNLEKHVTHVRNSGNVDVVRLAKVWKARSALPVRTFVLELLVVEVLKDNIGQALDERITAFWEKLRDQIDDITIEDPANPTGNDLSSIYGQAEKDALVAAATLALDLVGDNKWSEVFGVDPATPDEQPEPTALVEAADASHREVPQWPVAAGGTVQIRARAHGPGGRVADIENGKSLLLDGRQLEFRATTNVPPPFDVKWQVVNTGQHARSRGALRGKDFFSAKRSDGGPSADPLVTWERTEYTGTHWIECFILKQGTTVATGRFYVNIFNPAYKGYRPPPARRRRWWPR